MKNDNPWGLPPSELRAVGAICEFGSSKRAAREIGISHRTLEVHMASVRKKMKAPTSIVAVLTYDRWERTQQEAA